MRFSIISSSSCSATRLVLILQGDVAFWFKVVDDQVVDCHAEYLLEDCLEREAHCPWFESSESTEPILVELVLDTTLDEVDRVSVERGNSLLVNRYRKHMTLARLRKDYSKASVYQLPEGDQASVAALMHPAIPEQWASWLLRLQASNLVFHRVATGSELATYWSRHFYDPTLFIMRVAGYERHLLVQKGALLFLRTVQASKNGYMAGTERDQSVVDQSIAYISTVIAMQTDSIAVVQPHCSTRSVTKFADTLSEICSHNSCNVDQISVLLSMLLEQELDFRSTLSGKELAQKRSLRINSKLTQYRVFGKRIVLSWKRFPGCLSVKRKLVTDRWALQRSALRWLSAFEPSVYYVNASRRIAAVFGVSLIFSVIAAGAAAGALFNGISGKRLMYRNEIQQVIMKEAQEELYASSVELALKPEIASDSLFVADKLSGSTLIKPDVLLEKIATVVTASSGIHLDRLVWALADGEELYESLAHSLDSERLWSIVEYDSSHAVVQLELSGRISGDTLNEQQDLLNEFVNKLLQVQGARDANVLESPVDNALSSEFDVNSLGRYRVSLVLGGRQ